MEDGLCVEKTNINCGIKTNSTLRTFNLIRKHLSTEGKISNYMAQISFLFLYSRNVYVPEVSCDILFFFTHIIICLLILVLSLGWLRICQTFFFYDSPRQVPEIDRGIILLIGNTAIAVYQCPQPIFSTPAVIRLQYTSFSCIDLCRTC